jgi:hypothetical protein
VYTNCWRRIIDCGLVQCREAGGQAWWDFPNGECEKFLGRYRAEIVREIEGDRYLEKNRYEFLNQLLGSMLRKFVTEVKMEDFNEIRARLFLTNPDAATAEAFDRAIELGSIMRDEVCPVLDANGNPLVVGAIYQHQRHYTSVKIKIRKWAFGSGNLLNRYYRVFYTDDQLEDSFLVIEAQYPNGIFGGAVYQSKLVPVESQSAAKE